MVTAPSLKLTITWANWKKFTMIGSNVRFCLGGKITRDRVGEHNEAVVFCTVRT